MTITSAPRGALLPLHIGDNLTIPLVVDSATWIVAAAFGMELGARRAVGVQVFHCTTQWTVTVTDVVTRLPGDVAQGRDVARHVEGANGKVDGRAGDPADQHALLATAPRRADMTTT